MDSLTPGVHSEDLSEGSGAQDCCINEAGVDCELERTDKAIGGLGFFARLGIGSLQMD